jgi:uncharacterized protein with FMN-binding domain
MKKYKTIIYTISCLVLIISGGFGISYYLRYRNYQQMIDSIHIPSVSLSEIEDGSYIGEYDVDFIKAKVEIEIQNHKIKNVILLEHENDRGEKANALPEIIVKEQRIDVDIITGATNSSKVIQQAIINALEV